MWVSEDESLKDWNKMPQCMSPIKITTVDASNQKAINGVSVALFVDSKMVRVQDYQVTDTIGGAPGKAHFYTALKYMTFKATLPDYVAYTWTLDRVKNCNDPKDCGAQFAMMPKVNSGEVSWNECSFSVKPGKEEFKMRAVLEWDDFPKDFDIWVRNYDCFDHVAKLANCDENSNE